MNSCISVNIMTYLFNLIILSNIFYNALILFTRMLTFYFQNHDCRGLMAF